MHDLIVHPREINADTILSTNFNTNANYTENLEATHIDGDFGAWLLHKGICGGRISYSRGLTSYYDEEYFPDLCEIVQNEWIIVQLQAGETKWSEGNFRQTLVRHIKAAAQSSGIKKLYMMSAERNYWMIPEVQDQLIENYKPLPKKETLNYNYDWTAKQNNFKKDSKTGLYLLTF